MPQGQVARDYKGDLPIGDLDNDLQLLYKARPYAFGGEGYLAQGIMEPRAAVARALRPSAVFEFGTLYGYALMALLFGSRGTIRQVGWCDDQSLVAESNTAARGNIHYAQKILGNQAELTCYTHTLDALQFAQHEPDLVLVDGGHDERSCLLDTLAALRMFPRCLLFDDWIPNHPGVERVIWGIHDMLLRQNVDVHLRRIPTVNGIGVMTTSYKAMHQIATSLNAQKVPLFDANRGEHA